MPEPTKRQELELLRGQLDSERSTFIPHWRELGDYILPRRPRFMVSDVNKGDRRSQKIIDPTATLAARTLSSGMMGGITSPAREWFRLTTPDAELAEVDAVKEWCHTVTQRMSDIFRRSNLYNVLPTLYLDLGVFGTAPIYIDEDFDQVILAQSFPIGSYWIAKDERGRVNVFMREFKMTVRQLVSKFGSRDRKGNYDWSNFSTMVKSAWDRGSYEEWVDVTHVVQPNPDYNPSSPFAKEKRVYSCYYERGVGGQAQGKEVYLRESGYDYFPVLCPRWSTTGEDTYATACPGMDTLPDIKQLQHGEKKAAKAIDKMVDPPLTGPSTLRNARVSLLPGDITFSDEREGTKGLRATHEVNFRIEALENKQQQVRMRIDRGFFADLFLMLSQSDRREITAREIEERHEEKLLALGPVYEGLSQELLDPLVDITFNIMLRQGLVPEPPEELQGMPLRVEYTSIMAAAQKSLGVSSIERHTGFVGGLVTQFQDPTIADKVDLDETIALHAEALGLNPKITRSEDVVQGIRQGRAQKAQQQQAVEGIAQGAGAVKDLAGASLEGDNALSRLVDTAKAGQIAP